MLLGRTMRIFVFNSLALCVLFVMSPTKVKRKYSVSKLGEGR